MNYSSAPYLLLVDDDVDISATIKAILTDEGYEVICVHNGIEALAHLRAHDKLPALILLDIMMPKMNGYEFRTEQLKDKTLSSIPTILFSAAGSFEVDNSYQFTAIVKKPLDLDHLTALVKNYLV